MSSSWSADKFRDTFHDQIMKLVEDKARAGHVEQVEKIGAEAAQNPSNVVDLTELLMRSIRGSKAAPAAKKAAPAKKAAAKKAPGKLSKEA